MQNYIIIFNYIIIKEIKNSIDVVIIVKTPFLINHNSN